MDKPLIIYHGGCPDGWCAAWVALRRYPEAEIYPGVYQTPPPDVASRDVLIVDFSYPRRVLEEMRTSAASLLVLDHHKTAQADLAGLPYAIFDMAQSGAGLTWRSLFPGETPPWLVRYVEDRDLWRHVLPRSREVNAFISTLPRGEPGDMAEWDEHMGAAVPTGIAELGAVVLRAREQYVKHMLSMVERGTVAGHDVPVVNAPVEGISELLDAMAEAEPFAAGWRRTAAGVYSYSLRSRDGGLDVSQIARRFGGGGHAQASGFSAPELVHLGL